VNVFILYFILVNVLLFSNKQITYLLTYLLNDASFVSKTEAVLAGTDVNEVYKKHTEFFLESMARYQRGASSFRFKSVVKLDINTVVYRPLNGSSYIPLLFKLANKKAIINMINEDDQCFKWCIARALNPIDNHPERIDKKLKLEAEKLNWKGINFPVNWHDIDKFERRNVGLSVNVFGYDGEFTDGSDFKEKEVYPLR